MGLERGAVFCPFVFYGAISGKASRLSLLSAGCAKALEEFRIKIIGGLIAQTGDD